MKDPIVIGRRSVGTGQPTYIVAEISANHRQKFEEAVKLVRAAKEVGADAVKVQTFTPDTITLRSDREDFRVGGGTLWDGRTLYDLYEEAHMPWEWQPKLKAVATDLGLDFFSSPFDPTALSDHTLGMEVSEAAVSLGACIIEKHFTLSRSVPGPDSAFSLEPSEFRALVQAIRVVEKSLGTVRYGVSPAERKSLPFRRSLFVVRDVTEGEVFTPDNVRSIRPGTGLHPRELKKILGRKAAKDIARGTPLSTELID